MKAIPPASAAWSFNLNLTGSQKDGVLEICPSAQINCNASRRSRRADIEVSVAKRLVRQSIEGDRLVGLGDAEGVYTRS